MPKSSIIISIKTLIIEKSPAKVFLIEKLLIHASVTSIPLASLTLIKRNNGQPKKYLK